MYTDRSAGRSIGKLSHQIRRRLDSFSSQNGISGSQGRILHYVLAQSEDVFQKDIEREFFLRPSSATEILKLMEKNGLIRRESAAHDARLKKIIVTERAAGLKAQVVADLDGLERDLTQGIDPEQLAAFFDVVEQMSNNLRE